MMFLPAKMSMEKQGQLPDWMMTVGSFLFPKEEMSCSLILLFGVLLMIRLFGITAQPS